MTYLWQKEPTNVYYVSGVFTNHSGLVSHYAVHSELDPGISACVQFNKQQLIDLIQTEKVTVFVLGWDYKSGRFLKGKQVFCSKESVFTEPKEDRTKNLKHLIRINWFGDLKSPG